MTSNDQYYIDETENYKGLSLVLKVPWRESFKSVIEKENISVLRLSRSAGWKDDDISFLRELPHLRGVYVNDWDLKDLTPLQSIPGLEYLGFDCLFTKGPDFSMFKNLKICMFTWRPKAKSVFSCSGLSLLNIDNYPSEDFNDIKQMKQLKRLQIMSRKLVSLLGIEGLTSLSHLDLAYCTKLENLAGIEQCQKLEKVEIQVCRKLNDISPLGALKGVKYIDLTDCGKIKSIKPLVNCKALEILYLIGDTQIEDGEMSPLLELPNLKKVLFRDWRHYSHNNDQITDLLGISTST